MTELSNPLDPVIAEEENRTLDRTLRHAPPGITSEDWPQIVAALRGDRARFIHAAKVKEEKASE
jgi:hypothetical protein